MAYLTSVGAYALLLAIWTIKTMGEIYFLQKISFHYDLKNPFNFLTAKLFTAWGKPLYQILEPVQVSNEGQMNIPLIKNNQLLPSGNYILKFEIANPKTLQKSTQVERITIKYP